MNYRGKFLIGAGLLALGACSGGPQFVSVPGNLQAMLPAKQVLAEARAA